MRNFFLCFEAPDVTRGSASRCLMLLELQLSSWDVQHQWTKLEILGAHSHLTQYPMQSRALHQKERTLDLRMMRCHQKPHLTSYYSVKCKYYHDSCKNFSCLPLMPADPLAFWFWTMPQWSRSPQHPPSEKHVVWKFELYEITPKGEHTCAFVHELYNLPMDD